MLKIFLLYCIKNLIKWNREFTKEAKAWFLFLAPPLINSRLSSFLSFPSVTGTPETPEKVLSDHTLHQRERAVPSWVLIGDGRREFKQVTPDYCIIVKPIYSKIK